MTWFSKTFAICAALMVLGFTLEGLGYKVASCRKRCKNETDDHLCCMKMYKMDNGGETPSYVWLRNECERSCFSMYGEYKRVKMEHCTKSGQNHSTYMCTRARVHPGLWEECMRNQSFKNEPTKN